MSRLVVVSNRVANIEAGAQAGGLAVALYGALKASGGVWFGWSGDIIEASEPRDLRVRHEGEISLATLPLTQDEYNNYYLGFSNSVLWPVLHYRLDLARFEPSFWDSYVHVTRLFARHLANLIEPTDMIWVHDYHLILLGVELRNLGITQKIGFFLHIPLPPPEVLSAAPNYNELIRGLMAYDVIGLQTKIDTGNLRRFVAQQNNGRVENNGAFEFAGQRSYAAAFPIGIDADNFAAMARTPEAESQIARLERRATARAHIIGVDRLDYTKGLPERLRAFHRLIELHPEYRKAVTLMQIAPPTREEVEAYVDIRHELEALSGLINGELGDFDWTPVRYIHRSVSRSLLAALLRGSRIGLVTPLRDGMNLVAKEYVAAQDEKDPGVLVLSRFAGAAEQMREALIVNPYDTDEVAEAIHQGLSMPLDERRARHRALLDSVRRNDVVRWREDFLETLRAVPSRAPA